MSNVVVFPTKTLQTFVIHLIGTRPLRVHGRLLRETTDSITIWKDDESEIPVVLVLKDAVAAVQCMGDVAPKKKKRRAS